MRQTFNHYDERYLNEHSAIDQFAAAIAGLAQPGMSAAESFEHFLMMGTADSIAAEHLIEEKTEAFGFADQNELSHRLEPLIAHHLREFWGKDILPSA